MDGKTLVEFINLNTGGNSEEDPYHTYKLGQIKIVKYEEHSLSRDARPDGLTRSFIANLEYKVRF